MATFADLDLPQDILIIIKQRCKEQNSTFNKHSNSEAGAGQGGFTWHNTPEDKGDSIWHSILGVSSNLYDRIEGIKKLREFHDLKDPNALPNLDISKISEDPIIYLAEQGDIRYKITIEKMK